MPPRSSIAVAAFARVFLQVTGLVVAVVLEFYVPPTAEAIRRPVKSLQYPVSLLYQLGRTLLDCQYIIRVAEESCSNCSLLPNQIMTDYFRLWLFS